MNKTLKRLIKKGKSMKKPKIVAVNRPPTSSIMKWLLIAALLLLAGFCLFYILKITSPGVAALYAEKFEVNEESPKYEVLFVKNPDCPACIAFQPVFDKVRDSMPGVKFTEETASSPAVASYSISVVPTLFIKDTRGTPIPDAKKEGGMSEKELITFINSFVPAQYTSVASTPTVSSVTTSE